MATDKITLKDTIDVKIIDTFENLNKELEKSIKLMSDLTKASIDLMKNFDPKDIQGVAVAQKDYNDNVTESTKAQKEALSTVEKLQKKISELSEEEERLKMELSEKRKEIQNNIKEQNAQSNSTDKLRIESQKLKKELRDGVAAMGAMKAAGKENSAQYKELANRMGFLQDAIDGARQEVKALASDTKNIDQVVGAFTVAANIAQVYEGSLQALGIKNDDVARGIQKLVAIQSVLNGIQSLQNNLQKESAFMLGVSSLKLKAQAVAQTVYTTAVGTSTGALKAFRVALLATGIGAIIAGVTALVMNWDKLTSAFSSSAKEANKLNAELDRIKKNNEDNAKWTDFTIRLAKERGATEIELTKLEQKRNEEYIAGLKQEIDNLYLLNSTLKDSEKQKENTALIEQKNADLIAAMDERIIYNVRLKRQEEEESAKQKEKAEERKRKAMEETAIFEQKKADDKRIASEKEFSKNFKKIDNEKAIEEYLFAFTGTMNERKLEQTKEQKTKEYKSLLKMQEDHAARTKVIEDKMVADKEEADRKKKESTQQYISFATQQAGQLSASIIGYVSQELSNQQAMDIEKAKSKGASEEEISKIEKKYAQKRKNIALVQAIINTALGVTNALNTQPFMPLGLIMAVLAAAAGAVEIATISSAQFAKGTKDSGSKGQMAWVGEEGTERINRADGSYAYTPNRATLTYLPPHSEVVPNPQLQRELAELQQAGLARKKSENYQEKEDYKELIRAIKKRDETYINITENGVSVTAKKGNDFYKYIDRKYRK